MNQPTQPAARIVDIHTAYIHVHQNDAHLHFATVRSDWSLGEIGAFAQTFKGATTLKAQPAAFENLLKAMRTGQPTDMTRAEYDAPHETRDFATFLDDMREAIGGKRTNGYVSKLANNYYLYTNLEAYSTGFSDLRTMDLELEYEALRMNEGELDAKRMMRKIASNRFAAVRSTMADNATCPKFLLETLVQDRKTSVARAAAKNIVNRGFWDLCDLALEYEGSATKADYVIHACVLKRREWLKYMAAAGREAELVSICIEQDTATLKTMAARAPRNSKMQNIIKLALDYAQGSRNTVGYYSAPSDKAKGFQAMLTAFQALEQAFPGKTGYNLEHHSSSLAASVAKAQAAEALVKAA